MRFVALLIGLTVFAGAAPARSVEVAHMWDLVESPSWTVMVRSVERLSAPIPSAGSDYSTPPTGRIAVFMIDLTNREDGPVAPSARDFILSVEDGSLVVSLTSSEAAAVLSDDRGATVFGTPIQPHETIRTLLLFDIDAHAGRLVLRFLPAPSTPIQIDECHCNLPSPTHPWMTG
jgi:hypothetical protein